MTCYFSCSSSVNISLTLIANTFEIFKARTVDGVYLSVSIELMVCLETFTLSARSCLILSLLSIRISKINLSRIRFGFLIYFAKKTVVNICLLLFKVINIVLKIILIYFNIIYLHCGSYCSTTRIFKNKVSITC